MSALNNGNMIWAHATLKPLDAIYHSTLLLITLGSSGTHHCELFEKVGWT